MASYNFYQEKNKFWTESFPSYCDLVAAYPEFEKAIPPTPFLSRPLLELYGRQFAPGTFFYLVFGKFGSEKEKYRKKPIIMAPAFQFSVDEAAYIHAFWERMLIQMVRFFFPGAFRKPSFFIGHPDYGTGPNRFFVVDGIELPKFFDFFYRASAYHARYSSPGGPKNHKIIYFCFPWDEPLLDRSRLSGFAKLAVWPDTCLTINPEDLKESLAKHKESFEKKCYQARERILRRRKEFEQVVIKDRKKEFAAWNRAGKVGPPPESRAAPIPYPEEFRVIPKIRKMSHFEAFLYFTHKKGSLKSILKDEEIFHSKGYEIRYCNRLAPEILDQVYPYYEATWERSLEPWFKWPKEMLADLGKLFPERGKFQVVFHRKKPVAFMTMVRYGNEWFFIKDGYAPEYVRRDNLYRNGMIAELRYALNNSNIEKGPIRIWASAFNYDTKEYWGFRMARMYNWVKGIRGPVRWFWPVLGVMARSGYSHLEDPHFLRSEVRYK